MALRDEIQLMNRVQTAGDAKIVIGRALTAIGMAHQRFRFSGADRVLERVRLPIQDWWDEIKNVPDGQDYRATFSVRKTLLNKAYVEIAGLEGQAGGLDKISILDELKDAASALPKRVGEAVGSTARTAGNAAGSLVGGVLSGFGPTLTLVLFIIGFFLIFRARLAK